MLGPAAPTPAPDCWLHPAVQVGESRIEGRGLFATERIERGVVVSRLGGRLVSSAELVQLISDTAGYVDTITVAPDVHLVLPPRPPNGFGNHSCDPNLWWVGAYELATRRAVREGEELTNDYAASTTDETWTMPCSCGVRSCRGTVTGADYRTTDLVRRHRGHVVPAVRVAAASR